MITKNLKTQNAIQAFLISVLVVFIFFTWQGHIGFNLWDEGYLWYGVQRVLLGEVPIRDFMSYDPGRYYWSAALLSIWGDNGIMAVRFSVAIFQIFGLFVGILLIANTIKKQNILYLLISALILVIWMFPRHKIFDISISLFLIGALSNLIQNPNTKGYLIAGLCVGLIAVFGRNHGVYSAVGSLGVMTWLAIKRDHNISFFKGLALWIIGIVLGYLPLLFMLLVIPGFAIAFWESIKFLFEVKTTNLALPIPWPWLVDYKNLVVVDIIKGVLNGLFFIAIAVYGVVSFVWVFLQKWQNKNVPPALVATIFLALPYMHYAYSRADIGHLAQGIFPFLMGCLLWLSLQKTIIKWSLISVLCACSLLVVSNSHPGWTCSLHKNCLELEISKSKLLVPTWAVEDVNLLRSLSAKYTPNGESFLATPFWPGAYALLERKSPMWEIYALFPRNSKFENIEIERIKKSNPQFVVINNLALDGRNELRFSETHPLIYKYITQEFINNSDEKTNPEILIYQKK
jgi:hypothetical protein